MICTISVISTDACHLWEDDKTNSPIRIITCLFWNLCKEFSSKLNIAGESMPMYFSMTWNNLIERLTRSLLIFSNEVGIGSCRRYIREALNYYKKIICYHLMMTLNFRKKIKKTNKLNQVQHYNFTDGMRFDSITFWKHNISSKVNFSRACGPTDFLEKNPRFPAEWICFCIALRKPSTCHFSALLSEWESEKFLSIWNSITAFYWTP